MTTKRQQLKEKIAKHREEIAMLGLWGATCVAVTSIYGVYSYKANQAGRETLNQIEMEHRATQMEQQQMYRVQSEYYSRKLNKMDRNPS